MEPFFIDRLNDIFYEFTRNLKRAIDKIIEFFGEAMLDAYNKQGYVELEEISDDERKKIRRNHSHLYCYCFHAQAIKYRCGYFGVCRHGLRMRQMKKVSFNGKTLYK